MTESPMESPDALVRRLDDLAQRLQSEGDKVTQLGEALAGRDIIGQAKGILMERYKVDADAAFLLLHEVSNTTHTKLHIVAAALVRTGSLDGH